MFFSETPTSQHHNVALHYTHTLTNTLTLTHTHDWPTVASGSSGSREFFWGVLQIFFWDQSGLKNIWPPGGHVISENIFLRECKLFRYLCMYLYEGIMLRIYLGD